MSGRALSLLLALSMLSVGVVFTPGASAELDAPTLSARPVIDADIEEAEWDEAKSFSWDSPRASKSSVRMGYLDSTEDLALGFVLSDETSRTDDELNVHIAPRDVESGDNTQSDDLKLTVFSNGNWELRKGNGSGFPSFANDDGDNPSETGSQWSFAVDRSPASSWIVEMTVDIGAFQAEDRIRVAISQTDVDTEGNSKTSTRPGSFSDEKPDSWESTLLSGRPSNVQLDVTPSNMEAAIGGDVLVRLPQDAKGGNLTVSVNAPGDSGFTPIGTRNPGEPGLNTFFFAPERSGTYKIKADWEGDGDKYGRTEVGPKGVDVARPTQKGATVLPTGSLRAAFSEESRHAPASWEYLGARVWATDGDGNQLPLVELGPQNSCRKEPVVGFANLGEGSLELHFDPPVQRSAVALISPKGTFTANWGGYTPQGELEFLPDELQNGNCNSPVFESIGDIDHEVERVEIDYTGDDRREVVEVAFLQPVQSTEPEVTVRADPSPLHPDGSASLAVSAGKSFGLTEASVQVLAGGTEVGSSTCKRPTGNIWIDCPTEINLRPGTGAVEVEVETTDVFGNEYDETVTLVTAPDLAPPKPALLPRPMLAPPGGAISVTATAEDASGMRAITLEAHDDDGTELANRTCRPRQKQVHFECTVPVTPPEDGYAVVKGTYTDRAGNTVTVGPKPLPVRDTDRDGDGLPDTLETRIGTSPALGDTDGDGLSDGWEVVGVDRNGDGQAELDLAALGADPQVKDLFVEFDWAEHEDHSHEVTYGALQVVRNLFAAHGIRVHTDIDQEGGPYDPGRFDHGHAAHRNLMDDARAGVFMHVIAGHLGGPSAGPGWTVYLSTDSTDDQVDGRVGAQLLHEMGHLLRLGHGGGGTTGSDGAKQAAFVEDYKPNYLSVMNDAYAWGVIVDTTDGLVRVPTYASLDVGDLDEQNLDEPAGISFDIPALVDGLEAGPTSILEEDTVTGLRVRYTCPDAGPTRWALAPGPVDWNCNGGSSDRGVSADVNRGGLNSGTSKLFSRTDWDALSFTGASCPHYALMLSDAEDRPADASDHTGSYGPLGLAPCPLKPVPETPFDKDVKSSITQPGAPRGDLEEADRRDTDGDGLVDEGFADTDGDGVVNVIDDCPTGADAAQVDQDLDGRGDFCQTEPAQVSDLEAQMRGGVARLSWSSVFQVWGYNVYRVTGDNVTRLGDGFPSTTSASFNDPSGSTGTEYIVKAVTNLAEQGPAATATVSQAGPGDGTGEDGTGGNGSGPPQESVPGPGVLAAAAAVAMAALAARWTQRDP